MASLLLPEGELNHPVGSEQDQNPLRASLTSSHKARLLAALDHRSISIIGRSAVLTAQIEADVIIIAGEVNGDVTAETYVRLLPSARVRGNVSAPVLVMHEGAVVEGRCSAQFYQPGAREAVPFYQSGAKQELDNEPEEHEAAPATVSFFDDADTVK